MKALLISTDDTLNGGIASFVNKLHREFKLSRLLIVGRKNRLGIPPFYLFNVFNVYKEFVKSEVIVLNDPQFTSISFFVLFLNFFYCKKVLFVSHGFMFHNSPDSYIKKAYFRFLVNFVFSRVQCITVSKQDSSHLIGLGFTDFVEIEHGVAVPNVVKEFEGRKYRFGYIARNVPHKNVGLYLEFVISSMLDNERSYLVTDSGFSNDFKSIDVFSDLADEEVQNLLQDTQYFVSFSEYEGFGLAVIEAVVSGARPILFSNASFRSIFFEFPECLFKDLNVESASDIYARMDSVESVDNITKIISNKYSDKAMLASYRKIIDDIEV